MSDKVDIIEDEEFQFEELIDQFLEKRIQQYKLSLEIRQLVRRIYYLKKKYRNTESEEFSLDRGKERLKKYVSKFSSILSKDFQKLSNEEKRKLFKTKLLRVKFGLNSYKYQKAKDDNKETPIDKYVLEREKTNPFYLNTNWGDSVQKEIENFKQILEKKWKMWDEEVLKDMGDIEDMVEQEEDNEEEYYRELMEEIIPDPMYLIDDDPADIQDSAEYQERGYVEDRDLFDDEENVDIDSKYGDEDKKD